MTLQNYFFRSIVVTIATLLGPCRALPQGPCPTHQLYPVHVDVNKWAGDLYVNIETNNEDARCQWVSRRIGFENGTVTIKDFFRLLEKGKLVSTEVEGIFVSEGHYVFKKEMTPGKITTFKAYFLHHDSPNLDCHLVCTDDPEFANGHYQFYCEGQYPDAVERNAKVIKEVAEKNGIDLKSLMMVDNCNCEHIPYLRGPSKCKKVTIEEYFAKARPSRGGLSSFCRF